MGELINITDRLQVGDARLLAGFLRDAGFTDAPVDEYVWRLAASNAGVGVPGNAVRDEVRRLLALPEAGAR